MKTFTNVIIGIAAFILLLTSFYGIYCFLNQREAAIRAEIREVQLDSLRVETERLSKIVLERDSIVAEKTRENEELRERERSKEEAFQRRKEILADSIRSRLDSIALVWFDELEKTHAEELSSKDKIIASLKSDVRLQIGKILDRDSLIANLREEVSGLETDRDYYKNKQPGFLKFSLGVSEKLLAGYGVYKLATSALDPEEGIF